MNRWKIKFIEADIHIYFFLQNLISFFVAMLMNIYREMFYLYFVIKSVHIYILLTKIAWQSHDFHLSRVVFLIWIIWSRIFPSHLHILPVQKQKLQKKISTIFGGRGLIAPQFLKKMVTPLPPGRECAGTTLHTRVIKRYYDYRSDIDVYNNLNPPFFCLCLLWYSLVSYTVQR